jgi:hypothetical protein
MMAATATEGDGCLISPSHDYDDRDVECQSPDPECWGGPASDWEGDDYYECRECMVARIRGEQMCPYRLGPLPVIPPLPDPNCEGGQADA